MSTVSTTIQKNTFTRIFRSVTSTNYKSGFDMEIFSAEKTRKQNNVHTPNKITKTKPKWKKINIYD